MTPPPPKQQGMALIEALIASAILGIGLVGATQLALKTLNTASHNRQHTVAQQLAHEAMDCWRAMQAMADPAPSAPCIGPDKLQIQGVTYTRQVHSTPGGAGRVTDVLVRVSWTGLVSSPQSVSPDTQSGTQNQIEWHSSVSPLPSWVGVSLP